MAQGIDLDANLQETSERRILREAIARRDRVLSALVERLGGKVAIPVGDVDRMGDSAVHMHFDSEFYTFELQRKS